MSISGDFTDILKYTTRKEFNISQFLEDYDDNINEIGTRSIKVWKLNQCPEIKESSNFRNLLKNMSYNR